jgi:membrane-associated protease RseP (regulator of RpoE activity)
VAATTSVLYTGARARLAELSPGEDPSFRVGQLVHGVSYAASLMGILLAHEFGHYIAARLRGVPASLPYFLPMPFSPFGTWGAVIAMPSRITSRRALLEIGAAGPLAGMAVAIPVLIGGLRMSVVKPMEPGALLEGQCLLYLLIKRVVLGPIAEGHDVFLHPVAFAGWAGFFVTMINLLPYGQLDGGHIAYALLGPRQDRIGRWVRWATLPLFLYNLGTQLWTLSRKEFSGDALSMALSNSAFWLVWFGLLTLMRRLGGPEHPPTDPGEELGPGRTTVAVLCLLLFFLLFMPSPLVLT